MPIDVVDAAQKKETYAGWAGSTERGSPTHGLGPGPMMIFSCSVRGRRFNP